MVLTASVRQTLARDLARGVWGASTQAFWATVLGSMPGVQATPGLLHTLQVALATGVWPPVVSATLQRVMVPATPSVLRTLQRDWQSGHWSAVTVRTMETL